MKIVKLGDVCELIARGISPKYTNDTSGIVVINQRCIRNKKVTFDAARRHDAGLKKINDAKYIQNGDILINSTGSGTLGRTAIVEDLRELVTVDSHVTILRPKAGIFEPRYLAYLIGLLEELFISLATGTSGQIELSRQAIIDTHITYAESLEEQRRVVERLDAAFEKIDRAIELTEKNIENTDLLFRKLVNNAIKKSDGSPHVPMGEVCAFIRGPFGGSLKKQIFKTKGYAVYEQRHAIYDRFDNVRYFIDDEKYKEMSRFALHPGNLIMSCSGTMGKIAIVPEDAIPGIINQALLKLTPNDKSLSGAYLKLWMQSDMFQHALAVNSGGAAIKNVASVKILKEIEVPLPSIESQNNIVAEIDKLEKSEKTLIDKYGIKLRELKALKQSMLTQAFSESGVE